MLVDPTESLVRAARATLLGALLACFPLPPLAAQEPAPVAHWRFDRAHFRDGAFRPEVGDLALAGLDEPEFIGTGAAESLLRRAGQRTFAVRVEASRLPASRLTVEGWVAVDRPMSWGGFLSAIEDNGDYERGFLLGYKDDKFCFGIATEKAGNLTYLSAPPIFQTGRWYHVAGTYDGRTQRLYVDGVLAGESSEQGGAILYHDTHLLAVGAYKDQDEEFRHAGAIHEILLYDRALGVQALRRHFRQKSGRLPAPVGPTFDGIPEPEAAPLVELLPRIDEAIDRGVDHLLLEQQRDGSWDFLQDGYRNGATALALYTLVRAGVPPSHPAVEAALRFLSERDPVKTYSTGCQLLALGAIGDPRHNAWARRLVDRLLATESSERPGCWGYPDGVVDLSNTQFAALGLWGASRLGVDVPVDVWQRIVTRVIEDFQPLVREVESDVAAAGRTRRLRIGGFIYRQGAEGWDESGSMTTAGLCVLGLAQEVAGRRLGGRLQRRMETSKATALAWLAHHYTVSHNPGLPDHLYYYLYGIERVGALLDLASIGDNPWYRDGSEWIVGNQAGDGGWDAHDQTCFALLFLTRSTAPITGGRVSGRGRSWSSVAGDVHLHATGPQAFTIWITGFAAGLLDGICVRRVTYLADGVEVALVPGSPGVPWSGERFAVQHRFEKPGPHVLQAEVEIAWPGEEAGPEIIRSAPLAVDALPDPAEWMRENLATDSENLQFGPGTRLSASSEKSRFERAERAADGLEGTRWLCAEEDRRPWLRIELESPIRAGALVLSPADGKLASRGDHDRVTEVEVVINDQEDRLRVKLADDPLARTVVPFGRDQWVRSIELRILGRIAGNLEPGLAGFAEVALRVAR